MNKPVYRANLLLYDTYTIFTIMKQLSQTIHSATLNWFAKTLWSAHAKSASQRTFLYTLERVFYIDDSAVKVYLSRGSSLQFLLIARSLYQPSSKCLALDGCKLSKLIFSLETPGFFFLQTIFILTFSSVFGVHLLGCALQKHLRLTPTF